MGSGSKMFLLARISPALVFALAGCAPSFNGFDPWGGGGSGGPGGGPSEPVPAFRDLAAEQDELFAETATRDLTDPSTLPQSGTAQYDGVIGLTTTEQTGDTRLMLGDLSLSVDFAQDGNAISGTATNFARENGRHLQGELEISGGSLDRRADPGLEPTYRGEIDGRLTDGQGRGQTFSGDLSGDFVGGSHGYTQGTTEGTVRQSGPDAEFEGVFVGQK